MRINRIASDSFAGLEKVDISFGPGLNVILGDNEAGKSTLIEAMMHGLLSSPAMKKQEKARFAERFIPRAGGDTVDIRLEFDQGGTAYLLEKEFGARVMSKLSAGGRVFTEEDKIAEELQAFLQIGDQTLRSIVFARQANFKQMLKEIQERENIDNIQQFLFQSFMQMDGVSVGKLEGLINDRIEELQNNWDSENERPKNNKGIDNPWKNNVGLILAAYYKKETLKKQAENTFKVEEELAKQAEALRLLGEKRKQLDKEIGELGTYEADVLQRQPLESGLKQLQSQQDELLGIVPDWPRSEADYERLSKEVLDLQVRINEVEEEKAFCLQKGEKERLEKQLTAISEYQTRMDKLREEQQKYRSIPAEDFAELQRLQKRIQELEITMQAARLKISLEERKAMQVWVSCGLEEAVLVDSNCEFEASGFFGLDIPDLLKVEVRSAQIDFEEIRQEYQNCQQRFEELLKASEMESLNEAMAVNVATKMLEGDIQQLEKNKQAALQGESVADLEKRLTDLSRVEVNRGMEAISTELTDLQARLQDLKGQLSDIEKKIKSWREKYETLDKAKEAMKEAIIDCARWEENLGQLKPLPEGFNDALEFHEHIKGLREEKQSCDRDYEQMTKEYLALEGEMPEESYEELQTLALEAEKEWTARRKELETVLKVREAFAATMTEMEQKPLDHLQERFYEAIRVISSGRYQQGVMDPDTLELGLQHANGYTLPLDLLSAGTYDALALAFRLALLEEFFPEGGGILVLDDCLVDFDEERLKQAALLLEDFARNHQVILLTCHPSLANTFPGATHITF